MDFEGNKTVFNRLGRASSDSKQQMVCFQWRAGKCNRFKCPYLHRELTNDVASKRPHGLSDYQGFSGPNWRKSNDGHTWGRAQGGKVSRPVAKMEQVCKYWVQGNCSFGDRCRFVHTWCLGDCFSMLTRLEGHKKAVSGIALPSGSDKLYTGSNDETVKVWDCQSGQCVGTYNVGGEVGCMITEGPWVFMGLPNSVKALNTQTNVDLTLTGPVGQVYALVVGNELLFAGTQDGSILAWKFNVVRNCFEPAASLIGHTRAVITVVFRANRLYSGSMDHSIKVWNLENLQCMQTISDHTSAVMSVLCWDQFLLSCSLDETIKVWIVTDTGCLEVTYTHTVEHGVLSLCGMHDPESKPVLLCCCNDNSVRVYDLPSFSEKDRIFAKQEVRSIQIGPGGLFFTGDGTGEVRVWNWMS